MKIYLAALFLVQCWAKKEEQEHYPGSEYWSYDEGAPNGPNSWGTIFVNCTGEDQSPIDIITSSAQKETFQELTFLNKDKTYNFNLVNHGHFVSLDRIKLGDNGESKLQGIFFSWPSEHKFDGENEEFEFGVVYNNVPFTPEVNNPEEARIITILGEISSSGNTELQKVVDSLASIKSKPTIQVNLKNLFPSGDSYYKYTGSIPAPPCTKPVEIYVMKDKITLTQQQLDAFKSVVGVGQKEIAKSSRSTQSLGSRTVQFYEKRK